MGWFVAPVSVEFAFLIIRYQEKMCQIQILNVLAQAAQTHLYLVGGSLIWRIKYFIFSTRR